MINKHLNTLIALVFTGVLLTVAYGFEIDVFEYVIAAIAFTEHLNVDELIIPSILLAMAILADAFRRERAKAMSMERIKIHKAMISAVHHVMNNFLHQMQIFKMTAEKTPGFNTSILALYDRIIEDASVQIQALTAITTIDEESIKESVAPGRKKTPGQL